MRGRRKRATRKVAAAIVGSIGSGSSPIDVGVNDLDFINRYGLRFEGRPFDFDEYRHMREVYESTSRFLVLMAGAQTGKSARLMVYLARLAFREWGGMFGYYFPDAHLPKAFSSQRFKPFCKSNPEIARYFGRNAMGEADGAADAVFTRSIGPSTIFFLSIKGKTATEGLPMRAVLFDEVRRMSKGDIQRAEERTSAQRDPSRVFVSTALLPDRDIHAQFLKTDQRHFYSECNCADGVCLSTVQDRALIRFDDKLTPQLRRSLEHAFRHDTRPGYYMGHTDSEQLEYGIAVYQCPTCGAVITNPRDGWWLPHNPGVFGTGYQMPQCLTPTFPAGRVWTRIAESPDIMEINNSLWGLPYLDTNKIPVTEEHCKMAVDHATVWPKQRGETWIRKNIANACMGVDVQDGYIVGIVKMMRSDGRRQLLDVFVLIGDDCLEQLAGYMYLYDIRCACIDHYPHTNAVRDFARIFPGRVYLAQYDTAESMKRANRPMIRWHDRLSDEERKNVEVKFKHGVTVRRTLGMRWSLAKWVNRENATPPRGGLLQRLPRKGDRVIFSAQMRVGVMAPVSTLEVLWEHLQQIAFINVYEEDTPQNQLKRRRGEVEVRAEYIKDVDPHLAHANLYCDVALERFGTSTLNPEVFS